MSYSCYADHGRECTLKFEDLHNEAILWTCYLENFPDPERYLTIYGLKHVHRLMFDNLGQFFPFDTFYSRYPDGSASRALPQLDMSDKPFILPWIYWPAEGINALSGKEIIVPSKELFIQLDNKVHTKELFESLSIPTPRWSFIFRGGTMIEKPISNSAGGLGIKSANGDAAEGCFLEEYLDGNRSIGLQFFIFDEPEFICADEMLYEEGAHEKFRFHAQKNVPIDGLPGPLIDDCFRLLNTLSDHGYRGFIGMDALVGDDGHYLLEINPRGIAFTPAYFAASALGWTNYQTFVKKGELETDEILLLDFGHCRKIVKRM